MNKNVTEGENQETTLENTKPSIIEYYNNISKLASEIPQNLVKQTKHSGIYTKPKRNSKIENKKEKQRKMHARRHSKKG